MLTQKEQQLINYAHYMNTHPLVGVLIAALVVWVLIWKGIALWRAARSGRKDWYVVLLVVNTIGILEIVYIFFFSKKKQLED